MKARVSQLTKTEAEWSTLPGLVPFAGEFIVFAPDSQHPYSRLKVGDGSTRLVDLPFFIDSAIDNYITNKRLNEVIDAGRVSDYK